MPRGLSKGNPTGKTLTRVVAEQWLANMSSVTPAEYQQIDDDAAKVLASRKGWTYLDLGGLTKLSDRAAVALARHKGCLILDGLASLTTTAAAALAKHRDIVKLNGLTSLSPQAAKALASANHGSPLFLDGLKRLSDEAAQALARRKGLLSLDGLRSLSTKAASALARRKGPRQLNGLKTLSVDAAGAFARYGGRYPLSLNGLASLSTAVAESLAKYKGSLSLDGLESLSLETAEALAMHKASLSLDGVKQLSQQALEALGRHGGPSLSLKGLAALAAKKPMRVVSAPVKPLATLAMAKKSQAGTPARKTSKAVPEGHYDRSSITALKAAASPDVALNILKSLKRFKAAPTDEIFGDDPIWFFKNCFGTDAPVEVGEYSKFKGLTTLAVRCRDAHYRLIADRNYPYGHMRDMLVILSILNAELKRQGHSDRAYCVITPSYPAVLLLDKHLAAAAQVLRTGKDRALSLNELRAQYASTSDVAKDVPWMLQRSK